jgi:Zn-dependent membrane protease YugP
MLIGGNYFLYLCFTLPALLLGLYAQFRVQSSYKQFSRVGTRSGYTGAQIARTMLDNNGLQGVAIEQVGGTLTDHYDPTRKVLRLSNAVYSGRSIAAAGIAAHESGHAIQHAKGYMPLHLRTLMVPSVRIGSWLGPILFSVGLMMEYFIANSDFGFQIAIFGLILFAATALFAIVTLPVELNASKRAKNWLRTSNLLTTNENKGVDTVLNAAALTYVAAATQAIMSILYYASILFRRRD